MATLNNQKVKYIDAIGQLQLPTERRCKWL